MDLEWTDERVELLLKLHQDGLTYKAIGKMFGVSREAIAGKLWRLGQRTVTDRAKNPEVARTLATWSETRLTEKWEDRKARRLREGPQPRLPASSTSVMRSLRFSD